MTAAPVFLPWGGYTVSVGTVTLYTKCQGWPATREPSTTPVVPAAGPGRPPGDAPGQMGICACPGDRCHAAACARHGRIATAAHSARTSRRWVNAARPVVRAPSERRWPAILG